MLWSWLSRRGLRCLDSMRVGQSAAVRTCNINKQIVGILFMFYSMQKSLDHFIEIKTGNAYLLQAKAVAKASGSGGSTT